MTARATAALILALLLGAATPFSGAVAAPLGAGMADGRGSEARITLAQFYFPGRPDRQDKQDRVPRPDPGQVRRPPPNFILPLPQPSQPRRSPQVGIPIGPGGMPAVPGLPVQPYYQGPAQGIPLPPSSPPGYAPAAPTGCLSTSDARALVQGGAALPFTEIRRRVTAAVGGDVVSVQLCGGADDYVYVVDMLGRSGEVSRLTVDARSGNVLDR